MFRYYVLAIHATSPPTHRNALNKRLSPSSHRPRPAATQLKNEAPPSLKRPIEEPSGRVLSTNARLDEDSIKNHERQLKTASKTTRDNKSKTSLFLTRLRAFLACAPASGIPPHQVKFGVERRSSGAAKAPTFQSLGRYVTEQHFLSLLVRPRNHHNLIASHLCRYMYSAIR